MPDLNNKSLPPNRYFIFLPLLRTSYFNSSGKKYRVENYLLGKLSYIEVYKYDQKQLIESNFFMGSDTTQAYRKYIDKYDDQKRHKEHLIYEKDSLIFVKKMDYHKDSKNISKLTEFDLLNKVSWSYAYEYNDSGLMTRINSFDTTRKYMGSTKYFFNKKGQNIESIDYDVDGKVESKSITKYLGDSLIHRLRQDAEPQSLRLIATETLRKDGIWERKRTNSKGWLLRKKLWKYNKNKQLLYEEKIAYLNNGSYSRKTTFEYDKQGNIITRSKYKNDLLYQKLVYSYEY